MNLKTAVAVDLKESLNEKPVCRVERRGVVIAAKHPERREAHRFRKILRRQPVWNRADTFLRKRMKVYIESTIFDLPRIYINAGHRGICAAMAPSVLEQVLPDTQRVTVAID